ncbi:twisted gastrulation protein homolog 1-A-like [Watersipora subatra]|uniref:twisted gastrulation protein homolog 1-A-like n=1 Tax=Watersipora subatra TaxID=2589382 RepID=UPI00355B9657
MKHQQLLFYCCFYLLSLIVKNVSSCNDIVCGPIVTKCQLLKSCNCDVPEGATEEDCPCCATCAACLEDKYPSCCSCVGMCEPPEVIHGALNSSSVEDLRDPIPGLFSALTESEEPTNDMWSVIKYPAYESLLHHKNFGVSVDTENSLVRFSWDKEVLSTVKMENCTVAFVKSCLQLSKCKETCRSMGAARFRWFHNRGCCECIGDKCIDYGRNEALCERCSDDFEDLDNIPDDEL